MKYFLLFVFLLTFIVTESNLRGKENTEEDNEAPIEGYVEVPQASKSMLIGHKKEKKKKKDKDKYKISIGKPNDGREMLNHFATNKKSKSGKKK